MAVKLLKPTSNARRGMSVDDFADITVSKPVKSLTTFIKRKAGRNDQGKITIRHRGGGAKRQYRLVDFKMLGNESYTVETIEYDPNRSARIALISKASGEKSYILAPTGLKVGAKVNTGDEAEIRNANRKRLADIPVGTTIYAIEMEPGKGAQMARSAGTKASLVAKEAGMIQVKLPSGEMRLVLKTCLATIGKVGNSDYRLVRYGKAGRMRHRGIRPRVKGKNMNPVDHPHGGGEGHSPIGLKSGPKTKWGKIAMGVKTRKPGKWSNKFIVQRRKGRK